MILDNNVHLHDIAFTLDIPRDIQLNQVMFNMTDCGVWKGCSTRSERLMCSKVALSLCIVLSVPKATQLMPSTNTLRCALHLALGASARSILASFLWNGTQC